MTWDQMATCIALEKRGYTSVKLPIGEDTPTPGAILLSDTGHKVLLIVQGDGTVIDLFAVHRLAEDLVRNWQLDSKLPKFVGDFKRLTPLAVALNGITIAGPRPPSK